MRIGSFPLWPSGERADAAQSHESRREDVIAEYGLPAIEDDPELERITQFAAKLCEVPTALVTIVERERQWFIARRGMEQRETPRSTSFCAHAMVGGDIFEVRDATRDDRFAANPLVTGADNIRFYAGAPLVSSEGVPLGALCVIDTVARPEGLTPLQREGLEVLSRAVMQRISCERTANVANAALTEADRRLIAMAEHIPVYAWSADAEGTIEFANTAMLDYVGSTDLSVMGLATLAHPDDVAEIVALRDKARAKGERWEGRCRVRGSDGTYRWMMIRAWPWLDPDTGKARSWFGAAVDIDELTGLSESRELLARELSHRIKNIFAVVSSLVSLRARGRDDLRDFVTEINDVFHALGRAHDYVRPFEGRKGDSLYELLKDLLAPYRGMDGRGITLRGEDAAIGAKAATPLALVFHELATNSAKYGALASDAGEVVIALSHEDDMVVIDWSETFQSDKPEPASSGFGTRLIRASIEGQLGGSFTRDLAPGRLHVVLHLPQDKIRAA